MIDDFDAKFLALLQERAGQRLGSSWARDRFVLGITAGLGWNWETEGVGGVLTLHHAPEELEDERLRWGRSTFRRRVLYLLFGGALVYAKNVKGQHCWRKRITNPDAPLCRLQRYPTDPKRQRLVLEHAKAAMAAARLQ